MESVGQRLARAPGEHPGDRVVLGLGHPQPVLRLHRHLPGDVGAAVRARSAAARWRRRRRPCAWFGGPSTASRFSGSLPRLFRASAVELLRALLPGVGQRDDVVDLHGLAGALAAAEGDRPAGVRVGQRAGEHDAVVGAGLERLAGQVAVEDVVAGVAAVAVDVGPGRAELLAVVAGLGRPALDRKRRERGGGVARRRSRRGHRRSAATRHRDLVEHRRAARRERRHRHHRERDPRRRPSHGVDDLRTRPSGHGATRARPRSGGDAGGMPSGFPPAHRCSAAPPCPQRFLSAAPSPVTACERTVEV